MPKLNATDIAIKLSVKLGTPLAGSEELVKVFKEIITESLASGNEIHLQGFGKFYLSYRGGGQRKNPRSGELMSMLPHIVPSFKSGVVLKKTINDALNAHF